MRPMSWQVSLQYQHQYQHVCQCRLAHKLVYGKIQEALGVRQCVVSGGGSLQPHLDQFYEILDLTVLNGWGLSEV